MNSFYTNKELEEIGFQKIGHNVNISRKCSIYNANNISIGNNVRIDDYCILSGNIRIGNNVHISAYSALYGKSGIVFEDYSGCSARCTIYSETDDFSGNYMVGAVIPTQYTNVIKGEVILKKFAQLGANSVVLPGCILNEGAVTGSMTFVNKSLDQWTINVGIPCKVLKERKKEILKIIKLYEEELKNE